MRKNSTWTYTFSVGPSIVFPVLMNRTYGRTQWKPFLRRVQLVTAKWLMARTDDNDDGGGDGDDDDDVKI